jgi:branched-chain amino acid transport system permease protein
MDLAGILPFVIYFLTSAGIYSMLTIGLNVQWGYTGLLNIGIAGFYAVGAYVSVYLTHGVGLAGKTIGLALPFPAALLGAMVCAGFVAFLLGIPSLGLEKGYLAISLLGFGEIVRLVAANEEWLTNGSMGISGIYRPLTGAFQGIVHEGFLLILVIFILCLFYFAITKTHRSPWGRVLKAIREDEAATMMQGKNTFRFKLQAFVLGAAIMGGAGSLYAHYIAFINPSSFTSEQTFLIWIMLIVGGSGNDLGALLGGFTIWGFYVASNFILDFLPVGLTAQLGSIRVMVIASFFIYMLIKRPQGLLGEKKWVSSLFK